MNTNISAGLGLSLLIGLTAPLRAQVSPEGAVGPHVVEVKRGFVVIESDAPIQPQQRFLIRSNRLRRVVSPSGVEQVVRDGEPRGVVVAADVQGNRASAELPRGVVAYAGDPVEPTTGSQPDNLLFPHPWSNFTRLLTVLRPFPTFNSAGGALFGDLVLEHYFRFPFKMGVALNSFGVFYTRERTDASMELKAVAAFSTRFFEISLNPGGRFQLGAVRPLWLLGMGARLGCLDGLNLLVEPGFVLNNINDTHIQLSSFVGEVNWPVSPRFTLNLATGVNLNVNDGTFLWGYATGGVRWYMRGHGAPGTIILRTDIGGGWRSVPAGGGLTVAYGVESRF